MGKNDEIDFKKNALVVFAIDDEYREEAKQLATHLKVEFIERYDEEYMGLALILGSEGLFLAGGGQRMQGDFTKMLKRLKLHNLNGEMLVKAAKLKGKEGTPLAIDATAGMGEDSLLLAAAGFEVILFEKNPVIAALLKDTLSRAAQMEELSEIVSRMKCIEADSIIEMRKLDRKPDVILLDPMFPSRQKSGLIKKKFQLLQQLEQPAMDGEEMLSSAMDAKPHKIVIKRPQKGPFLADKKPDYSLSGKAIRYDCIILNG